MEVREGLPGEVADHLGARAGEPALAREGEEWHLLEREAEHLRGHHVDRQVVPAGAEQVGAERRAGARRVAVHRHGAVDDGEGRDARGEVEERLGERRMVAPAVDRQEAEEVLGGARHHREAVRVHGGRVENLRVLEEQREVMLARQVLVVDAAYAVAREHAVERGVPEHLLDRELRQVALDQAHVAEAAVVQAAEQGVEEPARGVRARVVALHVAVELDERAPGGVQALGARQREHALEVLAQPAGPGAAEHHAAAARVHAADPRSARRGGSSAAPPVDPFVAAG